MTVMKVRGQTNVKRLMPPHRESAEPTKLQDVFLQSEPQAQACVIHGKESLSGDQEKFVLSTLNEAVEFFGDHFGEVKRPLVVNVLDTKRSLRTGYSIKDDSINFPANDLGERPDLASRDILVHEAFHALVGQAYPHLVSEEHIQEREFVRLHEGLADYFAYQLSPDDSFAEGLGEGGKALRKFRNHRRISLSPGGHSQGNAITSYLLEHGVTPVQVRSFLEGADFSLEALGKVSPELGQAFQDDAELSLRDKVSNYPSSSIRKYWISKDKPLEVSFEANPNLREAHPELQIEWVRPSGIPSTTFHFEQVETHQFVVEPLAEGAEKVLAVFRDGEEVIGSRPFYFGAKD
jgi:hypothetical protein